MAINSFMHVSKTRLSLLTFHKTQNQATTICGHLLLQILSRLDEKCRKMGKFHTNPYVKNAFHCTYIDHVH